MQRRGVIHERRPRGRRGELRRGRASEQQRRGRSEIARLTQRRLIGRREGRAVLWERHGGVGGELALCVLEVAEWKERNTVGAGGVRRHTGRRRRHPMGGMDCQRGRRPRSRRLHVMSRVVRSMGRLLARRSQQAAGGEDSTRGAHGGGQRRREGGEVIERKGGRVGRAERGAGIEVRSERSEGVARHELVARSPLREPAARRQTAATGRGRATARGGGGGQGSERVARTRHGREGLIQRDAIPIARRKGSQGRSDVGQHWTAESKSRRGAQQRGIERSVTTIGIRWEWMAVDGVDGSGW